MAWGGLSPHGFISIPFHSGQALVSAGRPPVHFAPTPKSALGGNTWSDLNIELLAPYGVVLTFTSPLLIKKNT